MEDKMKGKIAQAVVVTLLAFSFGCQKPVTIGDQKAPAPTKNLVEVAQEAGDFITLLSLVQLAGLDTTLEQQGPFTLFAPTDRAFSKLPPSTMDSLKQPENMDRLKQILTYHLVDGKMSSKELDKMDSVKTVEGGMLTISMKDGKLYVNDAAVEGADLQATNGIIHVIDAVLIPSS